MRSPAASPRPSPPAESRSSRPGSARSSSSTSPTPVRDYVTAQRTDQRPKVALAAGLRGRGVFGGGGRYNVSLAHGDAEVDALIAAVEEALDRDLVGTV